MKNELKRLKKYSNDALRELHACILNERIEAQKKIEEIDLIFLAKNGIEGIKTYVDELVCDLTNKALNRLTDKRLSILDEIDNINKKK